MSGRNRSQEAYLEIKKGKVSFLPAGTYKVYVDSTSIHKGSVLLYARVLERMEEKDGREE